MDLHRPQKTIVVCVDDSVITRNAFLWALENVWTPSHHLRLVHVQPFHEQVDVVMEAHKVIPIYSAGEVSGESLRIAKKYANMCKEKGLEDFKEDIIMKDGSIGKAVCDYVHELDTANEEVVLVVGSRQLGLIDRVLLGSTSEYCVRNCSCPVIIVKYSTEKSD